MLEREIFVGKLFAVNRLAARPVALCEVAALTHETGNDAVEFGALEAIALRTYAKRSKILARLWNNSVI